MFTFIFSTQTIKPIGKRIHTQQVNKVKYNKYHRIWIYTSWPITVIIRIALLLFITSISALLLDELLLWLEVPVLPDLLSQLGLAMLLSAFAILLCLGLVAAFKYTLSSIADYFSSTQRTRRHLLFIQARQDQIKQLFYFRTVQLKYFNALKRTRLLKANNRKHIYSLSNAINQQLLSIKPNIAAKTLKELQQQNKLCRRQQNIEALLKLQQNIASLTNKND